MTLPMNDPRAADMTTMAFGQKIGEKLPGMFGIETVQIHFQSDFNRAPLQIGEHPSLDSRTRKQQILGRLDLGFRQPHSHAIFRQFGETWSRDGRRSAAIGLRAIVLQPLGVLDLLSKQVQIGFLDVLLHSVSSAVIGGAVWHEYIKRLRPDAVGMSDGGLLGMIPVFPIALPSRLLILNSRFRWIPDSL